MVRETRLGVEGLIYPMFVCPGANVRREVSSMPGIFQQSVDQAVEEKKDATGSEAYAPDGAVQRAITAIRKAVPGMVIVSDVCLCEYTDHGHCGIVEGQEILNDPTLDLLARAAVSHARAGADIVAPSDMMDGRVAAIRRALDAGGHAEIAILSYAAKYCSGFYGPFREAADSAPQFGDRRSYQMDPGNAREALREVAQDLDEGADMVIVKPALPYLDIVQRVRAEFDVPVGAYNVSGEYAMVKAAARNGWIDEQRVVLEILTGIQRAGADLILTYHAKDVARWLKS
jgi:porphobilinogen synthase